MIETGETVEIGEIIEISGIHAVPTHITENVWAYSKRLGEYPTLSAIFTFIWLTAAFENCTFFAPVVS
jgi:hypothetical protein